MDEAVIDVAIASLVQARWSARALRIWCWEEARVDALKLAIHSAMAAAGGDSALWRLDIIVKNIGGAELARLGYLDAAFCGGRLADVEAPERDRFIDSLSRLIATDGYVFADGLGEYLRDRFTRDAASPALYRPTALMLDLSFL